ncbi:MAG TPA: TIR domain-containing protein [Bryobacteraceae bacterium]|nr:TIR domain-containing protein [Bryobacteraceae bacterium]
MVRATPRNATDRLARIVRECLAEGARVEIDGIGTFLPNGRSGVRFLPQTRPRVFLAYVDEDAEPVQRLHDALAAKRFDPWCDKTKLLPGQNWPRAIESAIHTSDFFIGCFSPRAVVKRGSFQSELRFALECARRMPLDEIFFIPVRLEECDVPASVSRQIQYVDLFPDWDAGVRSLLTLLSSETRRRDRRRLRFLR